LVCALSGAQTLFLGFEKNANDCNDVAKTLQKDKHWPEMMVSAL
jgi:hypothetical protein